MLLLDDDSKSSSCDTQHFFSDSIICAGIRPKIKNFLFVTSIIKSNTF